MGVFTREVEVTSTISAERMFKAFVVDGDNLIPKILPQAIKSVEILEGDGGPGTIKSVTFTDGSEFKYMKHKVEAIDKENKSYSYSIIEGDGLMGELEKISYENKFVSSPDGGSICKNTSKFFTIGDHVQFNEEQFKAGQEKTMALFKAVEGYLLENPDAYN